MYVATMTDCKGMWFLSVFCSIYPKSLDNFVEKDGEIVRNKFYICCTRDNAALNIYLVNSGF